MRTTTTLDRLGGSHHGAASTILKDEGQEFVTRGVSSGVSVLTNKDTGFAGVVTGLTETTLTSPVLFKPGDFYEVTLPVAWVNQNDDGPIYDSVCRRCGFSFRREDLTRGYCSVCYDEYPWPSGDEV